VVKIVVALKIVDDGSQKKLTFENV